MSLVAAGVVFPVLAGKGGRSVPPWEGSLAGLQMRERFTGWDSALWAAPAMWQVVVDQKTGAPGKDSYFTNSLFWL